MTSLLRNPLFPEAPTIAESGFPGSEALSWSGLSSPKGRPKPIVDKLEAATAQAMAQPAIQQRMEPQGFVVPPQGVRACTEFTAKDIERWATVIKTAGIKAQ